MFYKLECRSYSQEPSGSEIICHLVDSFKHQVLLCIITEIHINVPMFPIVAEYLHWNL